MKRYYISFGQSHSHLIEGHHFFKDNLATFTAASYGAARELAFKHFGVKWCFCYEYDPTLPERFCQFFPAGLIELHESGDITPMTWAEHVAFLEQSQPKTSE